MLRVRTTLTGWDGAPGLVTNYFGAMTENSEGAGLAIAYVHDLFGSVYGQLLSNAVTWTVQREVDVMTASNGEVTNTFTVTGSDSSTGGGGANIAPTAVAALMQWKTATFLEGRRLRGRTYVSPLAAAAIDSNGHLGSTLRTAVLADLATWLTTFDGTDVPVVWRRPRPADPDHLPEPVEARDGDTAPIVSADVASVLAVLKSRRD